MDSAAICRILVVEGNSRRATLSDLGTSCIASFCTNKDVFAVVTNEKDIDSVFRGNSGSKVEGGYIPCSTRDETVIGKHLGTDDEKRYYIE